MEQQLQLRQFSSHTLKNIKMELANQRYEGDSRMKVVSLDSDLEPLFWNYMNQDIPHYYFFILDWTYSKELTKILLA